MLLKKLFAKIESFKQEYLDRSPLGKWLFVRNAGIFVLKSTGVPIIDPNFKVYWYSYAAAAVIIDLTISLIYTFWYNPAKGLLNIPLYVGVLIPSIVPYSLILYRGKIYQSLAFFAGDKIYTDFQNSTPSYIKVCDQSAIKLLRDTLITLVIIVGSLNVYMGGCVFEITLQHEMQLPMPVLLPFTDDETQSGFLLNLINQVFASLVGFSGNIGVEIITCMFKNNFWACTVAICHSVDEFSDEIKSLGVNRETDLKFRNILVQVQDLDRFTLQLSKFYYWKFFIQPIVCNFSTAFALFLYFFVEWAPALGAAFLIYSQMFILCDIGNEVTIANEYLLRKFYGMSWYMMSLKNQIFYGHLLNRLQNGAVLSIGPFGVLSFQTFSDMSKRIYSVVMALASMMG